MPDVLVSIDPDDPRPIPDQVADHVIDGIRAGWLTPGAKLPTVRQLAADLALHPNTVAKAYRSLEQQGYVHTSGRRGTRVGEAPPRGADEVAEAAKALGRTAQRHHVSFEDAVAELRRGWPA